MTNVFNVKVSDNMKNKLSLTSCEALDMSKNNLLVYHLLTLMYISKSSFSITKFGKWRESL